MSKADAINSDSNVKLVKTLAMFVTIAAVTLSLFQLYTAGIRPLTAMYQRGIHLSLILALVYALYPPFKNARKDRFTIWLVIDLVLILASLAVGLYILSTGVEAIEERQGDWNAADIILATTATLLVIEACRRVIGLVMTSICVFSLIFAYFGPYMPELFAHKGYSFTRITTQLYLTTEGLFGLPVGVAATFVFIFVMFGTFLDVTGGGNFFINLAYAVAGRYTGGPAKTAVLASGFMGSVSGSAVANVVTTGAFTIPMMKRLGYKPHVAGAIEAAASTGGQLMPPIMGAGAFLMAEFTNTSYLHIIKVALIPAVMYYMSVLLFVHFEAKKEGFKGEDPAKLPKIGRTIKDGFHFLLPLGVLIYFLINNYSPMMSGFVAIVTTLIASALRQATRIGPIRIAYALEKAAKNAVMVSVACAAAGIIVCMVTLTGVGLKFSSLVVSMSGGIKLVALFLIAAASLVLGMGLPVTASYIVLVILAGPALTDMGVPLITAHMIVFWYSQDANVTPPVSLASFAGAGVAGANPMRCAFTSWKIAKGLYIVPILMAYSPILFEGALHESIRAILSGCFGLVAFTAFMERYLIRSATWLETGLLAVATICCLWPELITDIFGVGVLLGVFLMQKYHHPPGYTADGPTMV